ncbi:MAG: prolipoprotein diacylglyceryl transferase [Bacteroidia bacterium]|nr:prolipoprotein diacylglyceryl transferase [Bacteroidia bacterium]
MLAVWIHEPTPFLWQWNEHWGIRYYGLAYVLGFLILYAGLRVFYRWGWTPLKPADRGDFLTWIILGTLAGGRLGYCLLYDLPRTLSDPIGVVAFWREGGISGMASHGAFVGIILAIFLFARSRGIPFWCLADDAATLAPAGLGLGRVANFLNGELWGRTTEVPWAVVFQATGGGPEPRHASQLYEAAGEGLFLFVLLCWFRSRHPRPGRAALLFFSGYAVVRIVCEHFREPDVQIGYLALGLTQGQWLSVGFLLASVVFWRLLPREKKKTQGV